MSEFEPRDTSPYAALKFREYRYFTLARFTTTFALQMQAVVLALLVYHYTHDAFSLGLIGLSEIIPAIAVGFFAGHITDRNDRRKILILVCMVYLLCSFAFIFLVTDFGKNITHKNVNYFYLVNAIGGLARGFIGPSYFSIFAQILPKSVYANGAVWNSTSWQVAAVAGPASGGLVYDFYDPVTALTLVVVLLLIAMYGLIHFTKRKPVYVNRGESIFSSLTAGFRYIFSHKIILSALSLDLFAVLFGGAIAMLPVYAHEVLHTDATGVGILRACPAAGAVIMAIILMYYPPLKNAGKKLLWSVAGFGLCIILFGISEYIYFSALVLTISGALDNVSVVIRGTILQTNTPDEMRGRVAAVNSMFIGSSNELGEFESGLTARCLGTVPSVVTGGVITMIIVTGIAFASKPLRNLHLGGWDTSSS